MIIDKSLLDKVTDQAKNSPRLRMNYNFHQSLDEKCHRFLNAVEPGTVVPIHHHPTKDETFVVLRGKVRVTTYNDDGSVIESVVLCPGIRGDRNFHTHQYTPKARVCSIECRA